VQRGDFLAESKTAAGGKLRGRFGLHFQFAFLLCSILLSATARGDDAASTSNPLLIYEKLKAFSVGYGSVRAENLVLKRDRVTITFRDGTLYFPPPIDGKVFGAVFIGTGSFQADVPPNQFEREDVRRLLKADEVSSDFKTAVLRFTDDTYSLLGKRLQQVAQAPEAATKLAAELDRRVLEETGANLSARLLVSILNQESPGFFFAELDGGQRAVLLSCSITKPGFRLRTSD